MENIGAYFGTNSGAITVTASSLLLFGVGFNWLTTYWGRKGYNDGYTWLLVVIGVAVTIIAAGFTIGWGAVIVLIIYFAASGFPMAAGDIWRHVKARRAEQAEHDKSTRLAE